MITVTVSKEQFLLGDRNRQAADGSFEFILAERCDHKFFHEKRRICVYRF